MKLETSCIRAEADQAQILRCKEDLNERETELCPCDFADILEMSVPAISQHLRKMKDINVISARRDGQTIFYSISKENEAFLAAILSNVASERKIA